MGDFFLCSLYFQVGGEVLDGWIVSFITIRFTLHNTFCLTLFVALIEH